jgi:glycosyltransferase involved in cell wall biosynthesis
MKSAFTINGRFLTRAATGVDRFALQLVRAWWPRHGANQTAVVAMPKLKSPPPIEQLFGFRLPINMTGILHGHFWEQMNLPFISEDSVLLNLCNSGPVARNRQLVVLHDAAIMATPKAYSFAYRNLHRNLVTGLLRHSAVIATVSKFSASEISRWFGRRARGIEVICESGEHVLNYAPDALVLQKLNLVGRKYLLAVGSANPNKNLGALILAFDSLQDLDIKLVVVGHANSRVFASSNWVHKNVLAAGNVNDGELRALYANAECFVFPSLYEGFGLPPLEAMHCGCPVVVSNRASMPEICGDAAIYCDPYSPADIADKIRLILSSRHLRQEIIEAGYIRLRQYSWAVAAKQLDEIIEFNFR